MFRDVKRSSKIRTSNKTFEFGFVFSPFDNRLLTAFCWMQLFVLDQDCVDHSATYAYAVRMVLLWCLLPWSQRAVFAGSGWEPWVAHVQRGWPPSARRGWAHVRSWNREIMLPVVGVSVGVLLSVEGRSDPCRHGGWRRNRIFSPPSLHRYSHILLESIDPWKGPLCGIACARRRCRYIHWHVASHPHAVFFSLGLCVVYH